MYKFESGSATKRLISLIACVALATAGCASGGRALGSDREAWATSISVGDHLRVVSHSGQEKDILVTAVSESGITAGQEFIAFSDIQSVRFLSSGSGRSGKTVLIIVMSVALIAALASLIESEVEDGFIQPAQ